MNINAIPFLLALAAAGQPALGQGGMQEQQTRTQGAGAAGGYGFSSGGPSGMRAEAGRDLEMAQADMDMPQPQTSGDVTYLCGGIGANEADFMNRQARDYDLKLTFAAQGGAYLADVGVAMQDAQGRQVLQVQCDGPILLVDVPRAGTYRIQADAAGFVQTRSVRLNAANLRTAANVVVTWPRSIVAQMEEAAAAATTGGTTGGERATGPGIDSGRSDKDDYMLPGSGQDRINGNEGMR